MTARLIFAALHLLGLGVGLGGVWMRARALSGPLDANGLKRVFAADTAWGLAALIWIGSGLTRAFGGFEKGSAYYLASHLFWTKMSLLVLVLLLELRPMIVLIRWRIQVGKAATPQLGAARALAVISYVQAGIVVVMVFIAAALARGYG
jgi:putative membrane protein